MIDTAQIKAQAAALEMEPATRALFDVLIPAVEQLQGEVEQLKRMLFGRRSEKLPPIRSEVRRVVEEEELLGASLQAPTPAERTAQRRKRGRQKSEVARQKQRELRKDLPVVHETVVVTPDQLPAGYALDDFRELGPGEVVRRVEHVREHLVVCEYVLQKLASKDGKHIVTAERPAAVVDGGQYGPGVYALAITDKCIDSLPLYRIESRMERAGAPIARSTLCGLFHRAADLLTPVYNALIDKARHDPYVNGDETPIKVQQAGGCRRAYVWTLLSDVVIGYVYSPTRASETPNHLLAGTAGFLQTDGYQGYNGVCGEEGRTRVGCWAHVRRKFFDALKSAPEAREVLDLIVLLYRIEVEAAERGELGTELHAYLRKTESTPIVDKIEAWLNEHKPSALPQSPLGKAIGYAINQREHLRQFLGAAKLALDNNAAERALRIVALGRKNYLFAGHDEGAQNLAVLQTIVATCRLHGVHPYEYVKDLLIRVQTHPQARIEELLPQNWSALRAGPSGEGEAGSAAHAP